jgi:hypothetical protein
MKKLLIAAVVASAMPALFVQAQAAPAKSPYCNMPGAANQAWAEYYGCWGGAPRGQNTAMAQPATNGSGGAPANPDMCKLPAAANASWAEHYGCWKAH